ncbi:selenocysteine lyase [Aplysia californica]|uniref:Selenocysteine lyase n=1 Tax=Aplysia californica TaxID=6500 RepID=A0ABM0K6G4_APLCA|nr:selenocysteine lyase [Aplysia californica]XP_005109863.1 selenocysteine lyase [Aplysia californica]
MVYLDYNATTPLAPEVIEAIKDSLHVAWGNPSSSHEAGVKAKSVIVTARKHVASMIGAKPSDIIFTSGGTEGNNWILRMALQYFHQGDNSENTNGCGDMNPQNQSKSRPRPHFITSNVEHDSVKLVLEQFEAQGLADVTFVPVSQSSGCVAVEDVLSAIRPTTVMVTIMLANNESGVIQPVPEICRSVKKLKRQAGETSRILLHTDAAQALGKIPVDVQDLGVDYLTIVGHKFYAPRIGAIFARDPSEGTPIFPLLYGGGQERNFRPGTENTPMIAGLGKAAELVCLHLEEYQQHMRKVRDYLETKLKEVFGDAVLFNGRFELSERLPNTCNVSFTGTKLRGHEILSRAPGVLASVGAACHAQDRPSHILLSMGVDESVAWRALRVSVGRETTTKDVDSAVAELSAALTTDA